MFHPCYNKPLPDSKPEVKTCVQCGIQLRPCARLEIWCDACDSILASLHENAPYWNAIIQAEQDETAERIANVRKLLRTDEESWS